MLCAETQKSGNDRVKRVAVVTGGAKGLGFSVARQLLEEGFAVAVGVHDEAAVQSDLAARLTAGIERGGGPEPGDVLVVHMDVKKVKSISAAAVTIHKTFPGGIDCVVNNAAQLLDGFDYNVAQSTLDVNFFGAQNVIRRMVPARWPDAMSGAWLPAKSGFKGMRDGIHTLHAHARTHARARTHTHTHTHTPCSE